MISNITDAEQLTDDEDSTEVLITVENRRISAIFNITTLNQNLNIVLSQKHIFCFLTIKLLSISAF
jgi:hypothetical protein